MKSSVKFSNEFKTDREKALVILASEKINLGKRSYADYLKEEKSRVKDNYREIRLIRAKHMIEEIHKYRKDNNIDLSFC